MKGPRQTHAAYSQPCPTSALETDPKPIASLESHDMLLHLINGEQRGSVLDVPCGRGALSVRLRRMGFDVSCCDIDRGLFDLHGFVLQEADLNTDKLGYPNSTFDYIVCANGLHRLFCLDNAICEFARCLKRDGKLFISIPNYASLWRRLLFLLSGSFGTGVDRPTFTQVTNDPRAYFRRNLTLTQLDRVLKKHGFSRVDVYKSRTEKLNLLAVPLYPMVRLVSCLCPSRLRLKYNLDQANSSVVLLGSDHVYVRASRS